jgi:hypothetical protein
MKLRFVLVVNLKAFLGGGGVSKQMSCLRLCGQEFFILNL